MYQWRVERAGSVRVCGRGPSVRLLEGGRGPKRLLERSGELGSSLWCEGLPYPSCRRVTLQLKWWTDGMIYHSHKSHQIVPMGYKSAKLT